MRISPEPLSPLRNWRELWQPEPLGYEPAFREQPSVQVEAWKQEKRTGFHWFSYLFSRQAHR